jgi:hypothetical protein
VRWRAERSAEAKDNSDGRSIFYLLPSRTPAVFGPGTGFPFRVLFYCFNSLEILTMKQVNGISAFLIAILFTAIAGCASTSTTEGTGEYIDDSVITTKVKAAILQDPSLKVAEINVETFKGIVQLSGFVKSKADISQAVAVARGISGVTSVKNDIRLK